MGVQLFIIRHGDPDYANDTLTAAGRLEAAALARKMESQIRPDALFSSPMGRARATMKPTEEALSMQGTVLDWAGELGLRCEEGPWGVAQMLWDVPGHWIRGSSPVTRDTWHLHPPFGGAEVRKDFERVCAASDRFLAELGYERRGGHYACVAPNRRKVAVFCHGGLGLTWLAHLLEIPLTLMWSAFWLPPSSVTTILFDERESGRAAPRCIGLADISHLHAAGLARSNGGLKANLD